MTKALRDNDVSKTEQTQRSDAAVDSAPQMRSAQDLLRRFFDMAAETPDEEAERLPTDGALNHDHYLYGAPKK